LTQITVKYVNAPKAGKNFGTIRGTDGKYYNVDAASLPRYKVGQTFDAPVKESTFGDPPRVSLWIDKDFDPSAGQQQASGSASSNGGGMAQQAKDAGMFPGKADRTIFATAIVGRAMGSGKFESEDIDTLLVAALAAYDQHLVD
jgi:hypothetical protein